jgi:hypothetical protein
MQLTWLDVLAGNIGGALFVGLVIFLMKDWRMTKAWQAGFLAWLLIVAGGGLVAWRAGCWSHAWDCRPQSAELDAFGLPATPPPPPVQ